MTDSIKTILFFPLNSPGHINSSLGIADRIKRETNHRTVFLLLGPMIGNSIRDHGHELIILDEVNPIEDYEIIDSEGAVSPEADEKLMDKLGKKKEPYPGFFKWPQLIYRYEKLFYMDPLEAFVESVAILEKIMVGELISNHDNYAATIKSIKPDLIVIDAYYIPPCIVNLKDTPWVRLYSANPMMILNSNLPDGLKPPPMIGCQLFDKQERSRLREEEPDKWQSIMDDWKQSTKRMFESMVNASSDLQTFMQSNGCKPLESGKQAHDSPYLNIYMYPKYLDYDQDDDLFEYPERWVRCDSLLRNPGGPDGLAEISKWKSIIDEKSRNKKHVVFFSLGSLASGNAKLMKRFVDILSNDQERLYLISKGVNGDKYGLDENNMVGDNYIPQAYFLQRSDLAIIHGGNNSITECLYHGLPMIVLPAFSDQFDNAQRVQDLGLGCRLNLVHCRQDELIDSIDNILGHEALLERAKDIGLKMRARDDMTKMLCLLDKLLAEKKLDSEFIKQTIETLE